MIWASDQSLSGRPPKIPLLHEALVWGNIWLGYANRKTPHLSFAILWEPLAKRRENLGGRS